MSEDTLRAVMAELPGKASDVRHRLGMSHEEVYHALVRLYDRGQARLAQGNRSHDCEPLFWEPA